MKEFFILNLPSNCCTSIWKKIDNNSLKINIKINNKKFVFVISSNLNICIDKWSNSIIFKKKILTPNKIIIENSINKFFKSINIYYFKKIKFKGKGFRIKFLKKNKIIKFFFGKSHMTYVFLKKIIKKRINKYKFIIRSINSEKLNRISKTITNIKKFNFYTLRGIRLSRQIIFKRKGKKGTYI